MKYERLVEEDLNVGSGTVVVTSPGGGTQTGHQIGTRSVFQFAVHRYGAVGDGVANDTTPIKNAIAAAVSAGGGVVYFPNGTYKVTGEIDITASYVRLLGESREGVKIVFDDTADKGFVIDTAANDPVSSLFVANGNIGDRTIDVASSAGWSVGDWIFLADSEGNTTTLLTRIKAIAVQGGGDSLITLEDALPGALTTAQSATAYVLHAHPLLEGIAVRDLTIKCASASPSLKQTLLLVSRCNAPRVENVHFDGSTGPLLTTRETYRMHISDCVLEHAVTVAGSGIENQQSTGLTIVHNDITMCQFGITFASSPYARTVANRVNGRHTTVNLGRGIRYGQSSNFGVIESNNVSDTNLYGIYLQDSAFCTIVGNTVSFCGGGNSDDGEHGVQIGGFEAAFCHHNTVSTNIIRGCSGYGITIAPTTTPGVDLYCTLVGNVISANKQGGIELFRVRKITIVGNTISANGATVIEGIIDLRSTDCGYCTIVGNIIANEGSTSCVAIFTNNGNGDYGHNVVSANILDQSVGALTLNLTPSPKADTFGQPQAIPATSLTPALSTDVQTDASTNEITFFTKTVTAGTMFDKANQTEGFEFHATVILSDVHTKTIRFYVGAVSIAFAITNGTCDATLHVRGWMKPQSNPGFSFNATLVCGPDGSHANGFVTVNHNATSGAGADPIANDVTFKLTAQNNDTAVAGQVALTSCAFVPIGTPSGAFVQP